MERLKHEGTSHSSSDLLKICVKMGASWSAQILRQAGDTPSGPGAFLHLFFMKTCRTSSSLIFSAGVGERGVAGGVNGCVERCSGWVWGVLFKPAVELIQIVCQLLVLYEEYQLLPSNRRLRVPYARLNRLRKSFVHQSVKLINQNRGSK